MIIGSSTGYTMPYTPSTTTSVRKKSKKMHFIVSVRLLICVSLCPSPSSWPPLPSCRKKTCHANSKRRPNINWKREETICARPIIIIIIGKRIYAIYCFQYDGDDSIYASKPYLEFVLLYNLLYNWCAHILCHFFLLSFPFLNPSPVCRKNTRKKKSNRLFRAREWQFPSKSKVIRPMIRPLRRLRVDPRPRQSHELDEDWKKKTTAKDNSLLIHIFFLVRERERENLLSI